MNINDFLRNDVFCQCIRKTKKIPLEDSIKRENKMKECNHLFVLLGDYISSSEFIVKEEENKQEKYECVHCGLTNKFKPLENVFFSYYPFGYEFNERTLESKAFDQFILKSIKNNTPINLISNEVLPTYHPGLLYNLAAGISENASNEEIFDIMKILHNLETEEEKLRLSNIYQAKDLLERYFMIKKEDNILKYSK